MINIEYNMLLNIISNILLLQNRHASKGKKGKE